MFYFWSVLLKKSLMAGVGNRQGSATGGPDPDPDADLYGPGPIINTLIGDFNFDGAILF